MVVPFNACIARPSEGAQKYLLVDHLESVAKASGSPTGDPLAKCLFLAGLLHDVGKAQYKWQQYANKQTRGKAEVNHAYLGAALFFLFVDYFYRPQLLGNENNLTFLVLNLTRDLANHHGLLSDLDCSEPPWQFAWQASALNDIDLVGLVNFVASHLPEFCPPWAVEADEIAGKMQQSRKIWFRYCALLDDFREISPSDAANLCLRTNTGKLIAADRFDAGALETVCLEPKVIQPAIKKIENFIHRKSSAPSNQISSWIATERNRCREQAMETYLAHPDKLFYKLQLPTGLGKTITGLNVSLLAGAKQGRKRIIYVAPYLSIISQAAAEIAKATGLEVLQHHHLAAAQSDQFDQKDYLVMESWQAPVVVTSFNQFFTGLFPRRAQHTMRLNAMDNAFIIIDEPQIIDQGAWNLFLIMLEALALEKNAQVLLMTATMPPLEVLSETPHPLVAQIPAPNRYQVCIKQDKYEQDNLAQQIFEDCRQNNSVAVILNTIADAANLFDGLKDQNNSAINCFNLHGAMHALHKKHIIGEIKNSLDTRQPTLAITTQIIEAGVDLSFQCLWRARPILPSVAQAAGRANRHGAGKQALVKVFDYVRNGKLTRQYVYKDVIAREETDNLLDQQTKWPETELNELVALFYQNYFQRQPGTAALNFLKEAAAGAWQKLAGVNPFAEVGYKKVPVFVPLGEQWLDSTVTNLMCEFNIQTLDEIYEKYIMLGWLEKLPFIQRKRFMALMQQFIVPVGEKLAKKVSTQRSERRSINYINYLDDYNLETGFGHLMGQEQDAIFMI